MLIPSLLQYHPQKCAVGMLNYVAAVFPVVNWIHGGNLGGANNYLFLT